MIRLSLLRAGVRSAFPPVERALREPNGLLAAGGDLGCERLIDAYTCGIFPWYSECEPILWWSPDPRLVFETAAMHVPRRLKRWLRGCDWSVVADRDFDAVLRACAAPRDGQQGTWITGDVRAAYVDLHARGHAHSIEVLDGERLVGGLYGVAIGNMFFAESMFSYEDHASKVALLGLAAVLRAWGWPLIDAQVSSSHLFTLGGREIPRGEFVRRIGPLVAMEHPPGAWSECFGSLAATGLAG